MRGAIHQPLGKCLVSTFVFLLSACAPLPTRADIEWAHLQTLLAGQQQAEKTLRESTEMYQKMRSRFEEYWRQFRYSLSNQPLVVLDRALTYQNKESIDELFSLLTTDQGKRLLQIEEMATMVTDMRGHVTATFEVYKEYGQLIQDAIQRYQQAQLFDAYRQGLVNQQLTLFNQQLNRFNQILLHPSPSLGLGRYR